MSNLRVNWSEEEDQTLLISKLAVMYLRPQNSQRHNYPTVFRDILHWRHACASSKTRQACQRRLIYILKNKEHVKSVLHFCLAELKQNEYITQRFGTDFLAKLEKTYKADKDFLVAFKVHLVQLTYLLSHMYKNLSTNTGNGANIVLPNTIEDFSKFFNRSVTASTSDKLPADPKTLDAIDCFQLQSLVHSSMCALKDKTAWNLQLFEVYKNYTDETLRKAVGELRTKQMCSLNKAAKTKHLEAHRKVSSLPLHLSIKYVIQMMTKLPYETFDQVIYEKKKLFCRNQLPLDDSFLRVLGGFDLELL